MIQEKKLTNYPDLVTIEGTNKILNQMKNCIAKIYNGNNGTGFFSHIPYNNGKSPAFTTNYHVINKQSILQKHVIKLGINDDSNDIDINLDINSRKIYLDEKYDLTIIEIKEIDKVNNNSFLELDNNLLKENSNEIYKIDNSIYIIQYPKLDKASVSYGIIKEFDGFKINHVCSTESGSSGSPILNLKTNKVIGIHNCSFKGSNFNGGIFLKEPIDKIKVNNAMKTIHDIKNFINKDKDILDMISNEEYEQNIKFFEDKEKKKNATFKNNNIFVKFPNNIINILGNGNNNNYFNIFHHIYNYGNKKYFEKSINDGIYNIIPMHCNNRAIEIYYGSTENMAILQLYEYNNTKAQQFEVKYNSENNHYTIKCLCSNKLLTVDYNNKGIIIQKDEKKPLNNNGLLLKKKIIMKLYLTQDY